VQQISDKTMDIIIKIIKIGLSFLVYLLLEGEERKEVFKRGGRGKEREVHFLEHDFLLFKGGRGILSSKIRE